MAGMDIQFSKRFSKNVFTNVIYFIINLFVGLALVPFFLDSLGTAAYGLIPLATSITSYIVLVIDSVNSSVSRFLTIDLQKGDVDAANKTYNTALFGTLIIILCLVPIALLVAWIAPSFFNIGTESAISVFLLFAFVFGSALVRAWSSNFMVTLFAQNRLDLRNYVNIVNTGGQALLIVILFIVFTPSLELVGFSYFAAALSALLLAIFFSRKTCPYLHLAPKLFSQRIFRSIGGMSFWVLTDSIGVLLRYQIALMMVNKMFGENMGTEYSLALQWFNLLIAVASLVSNVFTPMLYSYYAAGDKENLLKYSQFATKIMGLSMALPIALVCIFTPQLMTIWVGAEFAHLSILVWIIVAPCLVKIQAGCISPIYGAHNKVRFPALVNIVIGIITPILAYGLASIPAFGMYGIAAACSFSIIFIAVVMIPLYTAYLMKKPLTTYYKVILPGIVALFILFASGYVVSNLLYAIISPYLVMVGLSIIIAVIYGLFVLRVMLNSDERGLIRSCVPKNIEKYIPTWIL